MARLTAAQRNKLPPSAFVHKPSKNRSSWKYPVPTKAQARKAGISESQRKTMHATALAYSGRKNTASTKGRVRATVNKRK